MGYKKELINKVAKAILEQGFRVFIAGSGDYGFYTDDKGKRVVSFSCDLGVIHYSGNYKSSQSGTGWRMDDTGEDFAAMLNAHAPQWAIGRDTKWRYTTLEDHLKTYQWSSKYVELTNGA